MYSNFLLGPQYLHILPFLQASAHFMTMQTCSFIDSLNSIKKSHDPLLQLLADPPLSARMARGGSSLDIMLYDAFFLRKNLICATYPADCSTDEEILIILDSISKGAAEGQCITVLPEGL